MTSHIYIDDSATQGGMHVLAGFIATAEDWAAFTEDWERLLPTARQGRDGKHRFKMTEMTRHVDRLPAFCEVISRHIPYCYSISIDAKVLERAKARIWSDQHVIHWSPADAPAIMLLNMMLGDLYNHLWTCDPIREFLENSPRIEVYIDTFTGNEWVMDSWSDLRAIQPKHLQRFYDQEPQFVSDEEFIPIQAADLLAWWVRKSQEVSTIEDFARGKFGPWPVKPPRGLHVTYSEDLLVEALIKKLQTSVAIPALANVYDEQAKPRTEHELPQLKMRSRAELLSMYERVLKALHRR